MISPKGHCLHVTLPICDVCMHWHSMISKGALRPPHTASWCFSLNLARCPLRDTLLSDALNLATVQTYVTNANNIIAKYDDLKQMDLVSLSQAVGTDKLPKDAATGLRCPVCWASVFKMLLLGACYRMPFTSSCPSGSMAHRIEMGPDLGRHQLAGTKPCRYRPAPAAGTILGATSTTACSGR